MAAAELKIKLLHECFDLRIEQFGNKVTKFGCPNARNEYRALKLAKKLKVPAPRKATLIPYKSHHHITHPFHFVEYAVKMEFIKSFKKESIEDESVEKENIEKERTKNEDTKKESAKKESTKEESIEEEHIEKQTTLEDLWKEMPHEEKLDVCHQLRDALIKMRSKHFPEQTSGRHYAIRSIDRHHPAVHDTRSHTTYTGGPFHNEKDFNNWLCDEAAEYAPEDELNKFRKRMRMGHRIVFTHCDLRPGNIIVTPEKKVVIIDWEMAGYYPEHWEYVNFFRRGDVKKRGDDEGAWYKYAEEIFPVCYTDELRDHEWLAEHQLA